LSNENNFLHNIESDLWEAAGQLRANSKLTASEYSMPVLGLIFLRHANNRFLKVKEEVEPTKPTRDGVRAPLTPDDFKGKAAIYLPEEAQYDYLVNLPEDQDIGQAIVDAMKLIENQVDMLKGALPKEYTKFDPDLLRDLMRIFNRDALRRASGDVFGRIYEYFLNKFAMTGAQEGGEYFTPPSIVRMIVNVIEPDHGIVLDPATWQHNRECHHRPPADRRDVPGVGCFRKVHPCSLRYPTDGSRRFDPLPVRGHSSLPGRERPGGTLVSDLVVDRVGAYFSTAALSERLLRGSPAGLLRPLAGGQPARRVGALVALFLQGGEQPISGCHHSHRAPWTTAGSLPGAPALGAIGGTIAGNPRRALRPPIPEYPSA
jgi:hypothetical protein